MLKKVVFLDRDGVINYDSLNYIKSLEEFQFIPGSLSAVCKLSRYGFSVFIITNQSAIARKLIDPSELDKIHDYLKKSVIKAGGHINGIYFCPHHPDEMCQCRKPNPGLIHQAANDHSIDISSSIMVGDRISDIECAKRAGCKYAFWIVTDKGNQTDTDSKYLCPYFCRKAGTLFRAVDMIIDQNETKPRQY